MGKLVEFIKKIYHFLKLFAVYARKNYKKLKNTIIREK